MAPHSTTTLECHTLIIKSLNSYSYFFTRDGQDSIQARNTGKNQTPPNEQNHTNPEITFFAIIKLGL